MKLFILIIFAFQTCFAQKSSISTVSLVDSDLQVFQLVHRVINDFPDLESIINFIGVTTNKIDQLSALKSKIGLKNLKNKIPQVKLENNILIYGTDKVSIKNGKIYFNQMEILFDPNLNLAENYEHILSSLKKYKDQKKSVFFNLLIPNVYADDLNYKRVAQAVAAYIALMILVAATVKIQVALGSTLFLARVSSYSWTALMIMMGIHFAANQVNASTFLQNNKDICQTKGPNSFSNSYFDKDGIINETSLTLKDGLLVMTSTSNNKHKKTLVFVPNSGRVINEYDENKKIIPSNNFTKMTKEESESLFSIYKVCADPELRKEFKAKINEYSKLQSSGKAQKPAQPEIESTNTTN